MGAKTKTRAELNEIGLERLRVNNDPTKGKLKLSHTHDLRLYSATRNDDGSIAVFKRHTYDDPVYHPCPAKDEDNKPLFSGWSVNLCATEGHKNKETTAKAAAKYFGCVTAEMFANTFSKDEWNSVKKRIDGKLLCGCYHIIFVFVFAYIPVLRIRILLLIQPKRSTVVTVVVRRLRSPRRR